MNKLVIFSVTCTGMVLASQFAWEIVHAQDGKESTEGRYEPSSRTFRSVAQQPSGSFEAAADTGNLTDKSAAGPLQGGTSSQPPSFPQSTRVSPNAGGDGTSSESGEGYSGSGIPLAGGGLDGVGTTDAGGASPADSFDHGSETTATGLFGGRSRYADTGTRQLGSGGSGAAAMTSGFSESRLFKKPMNTKIIRIDGHHQAKEIQQIISQMFPSSHYGPVFTSSDSVTNSVIVKTDAEMMQLVERLISQLTAKPQKPGARSNGMADMVAPGMATSGVGSPRPTSNPFGSGVPGMGSPGMGVPGMSPMARVTKKPATAFAKAGELEEESLKSAIELQNLLIRHGEQHPKTRDARNRVRQYLTTLHQVRINAQREELERIRTRLEMVESRLKQREQMSKLIIEKRLNELLSLPAEPDVLPGPVSVDPFGGGTSEPQPDPLTDGPTDSNEPVNPIGTPRPRNVSAPGADPQFDSFDEPDQVQPRINNNNGLRKKRPSPFDPGDDASADTFDPPATNGGNGFMRPPRNDGPFPKSKGESAPAKTNRDKRFPDDSRLIPTAPLDDRGPSAPANQFDLSEASFRPPGATTSKPAAALPQETFPRQEPAPGQVAEEPDRTVPAPPAPVSPNDDVGNELPAPISGESSEGATE